LLQAAGLTVNRPTPVVTLERQHRAATLVTCLLTLIEYIWLHLRSSYTTFFVSLHHPPEPTPSHQVCNSEDVCQAWSLKQEVDGEIVVKQVMDEASSGEQESIGEGKNELAGKNESPGDVRVATQPGFSTALTPLESVNAPTTSVPPHSTTLPPTDFSMHVLPTSHPQPIMNDIMDPATWSAGGAINDFTSPLLSNDFVELLNDTGNWGHSFGQQCQPHVNTFPQLFADPPTIHPPSNVPDMTYPTSAPLNPPVPLNPPLAPNLWTFPVQSGPSLASGLPTSFPLLSTHSTPLYGHPDAASSVSHASLTAVSASSTHNPAITPDQNTLASTIQPDPSLAFIIGPANPSRSDASSELQTDNAIAPADANTSAGSDMPISDPVTNSESAPISHQSVPTIIPSTCAETMNKIGSGTDMNKENNQLLPDEPSIPDWVNCANFYLTTRDLGSEWLGCVKIWMKLEGMLEYGRATKVC
jgi:hypothetical protein